MSKYKKWGQMCEVSTWKGKVSQLAAASLIRRGGDCGGEQESRISHPTATHCVPLESAYLGNPRDLLNRGELGNITRLLEQLGLT